MLRIILILVLLSFGLGCCQSVDQWSLKNFYQNARIRKNFFINLINAVSEKIWPSPSIRRNSPRAERRISLDYDDYLDTAYYDTGLTFEVISTL